MRGGAELLEASLQLFALARKAARPVFEPGAAGGELFEGAVELDRDFAHAPHLVALGREHPGEQSLLLGHPSQRWVAPGRRFQFVGDTACSSQRLVAKTGDQGVKFDFQGQAGIRRFSLAGCQPAGAGREPSQRFAGAGPAGGGAFESAGQQAGAGAGPFRALAEQAAAARRRARGRPAGGPRRRRRGAGRDRGRRAGSGRRAHWTQGARRGRAAAGRPAGSAPGRSPPAPPGGLRCDAAREPAARADAGS